MPTWKESALHSGMLKAYLAWGDAVSGFVDKTSLSDIDKARAHLVTEILIDAVAPTNAMLTNPAAVRKFVDTGGRSLWHGLKNYFDDLAKNRRHAVDGGSERLQGRREPRRPRRARWSSATNCWS